MRELVKEPGLIYAIQRVGGNQDASFAVVWKLKRAARGGVKVSSLIREVKCPLKNEKANKSPDCKKTFSGTEKWGLRLSGTDFSLAPLGNGGNFVPVSDCGKMNISGDLHQLFFEWPVPPKIRFEPLPLGQLFGKASQFKVIVGSLRQVHHGSLGTPPLMVAASDAGVVTVTVRFTREPNAS